MSADDPTGIEPREPEPTPEEAAAAAALRAALDAPDAAPPAAETTAALEAAALLRFARDGGELPPARAEAVLRRVLPAAPPAAAPAPRRWWRWAVPTVAAAAAAAALALWLARPAGPGAGGPAVLPAPGARLVQAQLAAARGDAAARADLEREMRGYRRQLYAALAARYGERP